jgi:hypothetical protein
MQSKQRPVPGAPGGDQGPVHQLGAIINRRLPRERRQSAAGFVHQKVGSRKVPIVA